MANPNQMLPQCENCMFYRKENNSCAKHRIFFPMIEWQMLCKDWANEGDLFDFSMLDEGGLYYYSASQEDVIFQPLRSFEALEKPLIGVRIRRDEEYGWVIYVGKNNQFLPAPNGYVTVKVNERKSKFTVVNAERNLAIEMITGNIGDWKMIYHKQQAYMLRSMESDSLLFDWMDTFIDVNAYVANSFVPSFLAFLEVDDSEQNLYTLSPDLLVYEAYKR
jgi:hypothetical protein